MAELSDTLSILLATPPPMAAFEAIAFEPPTHPGDLGVLGPYRILRYLRRASIGSMFLGYDPNLRRHVWLKALRPHYVADGDTRARFVREARAAARVNSPYVIKIFEVSEAVGQPFAIFEIIQGRSLQEHLATHPPLSMRQILRVSREIAEGLAACHSFGLVHRELKPETIWLEAPNGRVKLVDFGQVRPRPATVGPLTNQSLIGLSAYTAPEQAKGAKADPRSDLFALGVILYKLISQKLPFNGLSPLELLTAILTDEPLEIDAHGVPLPDELKRLVMQMLEKDPANRPVSAEVVVETLTRLEQQLKSQSSTPEESLISIRIDDEFTKLGHVATSGSISKSGWFSRLFRWRPWPRS